MTCLKILFCANLPVRRLSQRERGSRLRIAATLTPTSLIYMLCNIFCRFLPIMLVYLLSNNYFCTVFRVPWQKKNTTICPRIRYPYSRVIILMIRWRLYCHSIHCTSNVSNTFCIGCEI